MYLRHWLTKKEIVLQTCLHFIFLYIIFKQKIYSIPLFLRLFCNSTAFFCNLNILEFWSTTHGNKYDSFDLGGEMALTYFVLKGIDFGYLYAKKTLE